MNFSRLKHLAKEGNWLIISQVGTVLSALILIRYLTEYLSLAEYGKLILSLTLATFFNSVVSNCLSMSIMRFYSIAAEENSKKNYLSSVFQLLRKATISIFLCTTAIIIILNILNQSEWIWLTVLVAILSILDGYNVAFLSLQNAARQRIAYSILNLTNHILKIPFSLVAIVMLGNKATSIVFAYIIVLILVNSFQIFLLQKNSNQNQNQNQNQSISYYSDNMLKFSLSFSFIGLFTWLHSASDRWLLQLFSTTADVALYNVVYQLGFAPIGMATGLITSFIAPILYQRVGAAKDKDRNDSAKKIVWYMALAGVFTTAIAFCITFVFHTPIFSILVAKEYQYISYLLPWVILSGGLFATGQVLALKLMSEMNLKALIRIKIATAVLGILFNLVGVQYGLQGVSVGLLAYSLIYFVWMFFLFKKKNIIS
jgi:O-antigen/teichoic acid export membrane protein